MRDFQKIDWKLYNKPPFYQQWMCRDETLKLATFGDKGLSEVDDHILSLKDQWDLDHVECHFLDRIGKLLSEPRNGNSDEYYRIVLNLRKLLNTNAGSIPDIIKAIKYLYSSEVVHIVPDYPAGLIIEHDGEGTPGLNFNRLLAEIIPAGVSFSTKELFVFTEEFTVTDALEIIVRRITSDSFQNGLKYNGRGKYDGHTLNDTEIINLKHNGVYKYDGIIQYRRTREAAPDTYVSIPFKHSNGIRDVLTSAIPQVYIDYARAKIKYNMAIKYSGDEHYSGFGENSIYDVSENKNVLNTVLSDSEATAENLSVQINKPLDERFTTRNRYDGYFNHSGETKYRSAKEAICIKSEADSVSDAVNIADDFNIGKRFLRKFNSAYRYDGVILYNGNVLIPV
jgi:hypothetical protein